MKYRLCATPIPIWRITGRLPHGPASHAAHRRPRQMS